MMKLKVLFCAAMWIVVLEGCKSEIKIKLEKDSSVAVKSEIKDYTHTQEFKCDYMNEPLPGKEPNIFAPGIVTTKENDESSFEISPNGVEIIFDREGDIMLIKKNDNGWDKPVIAPFSGKKQDGECSFSKDGKKIFFISSRKSTKSANMLNNWISEKTDNTWSTPSVMDFPNTQSVIHAISVAENGNVYCSGLKKLIFKNNKYENISNLSFSKNPAHPFISADERYLLFDVMEMGKQYIYMAYLKMDGNWSTPEKVLNKNETGGNPFVTPDGRYLFFTRNYNIYWVEVNIKERLKG